MTQAFPTSSATPPDATEPTADPLLLDNEQIEALAGVPGAGTQGAG